MQDTKNSEKDFILLSTKQATDEEYEKEMMPSNGDKSIDDVMKSVDELDPHFFEIPSFQDSNEY